MSPSSPFTHPTINQANPTTHNKCKNPKKYKKESKMNRSMGVAMLAMMIMALVMVQPSEAISCNDLGNMLAPCLKYMMSGGQPGPNCCNGARKVQGATRSRADRRTACNCAKSAAGRYKVSGDAVKSLPSKCGITTTIPINPNVDCNSIP